MAKMQGLVGGLSGKMGNAVFRQRYGQTIVAQYQPVVSNPNTPSQQNARAAFKLITQLAAIMSPGFGTMLVTKRPARKGRNPRTGFVAKNYGLIVADPNPEAAERVTIPMEQLQLTSSFRAIPSIVDLSTSGTLRTTISDIPSDVASVRFVVVNYITVEGASQANIASIADIPVENGVADFSMPAVKGLKFTVLAYGLIPSESLSAKVNFDEIHTPADEDFISAVDLDALVRDGEMSETITTGVNITIPEE